MSSSLSSPVPLEDQAKLLDEVLNVVKVQAHLMKKCLVIVFSSSFDKEKKKLLQYRFSRKRTNHL